MAKKDSTKTGKMLMYLVAAKKDFEAVFPTRKQFVADAMFKNFLEFKNMIYHLQRRGLIQLAQSGGERIIKLTKKGEMEALLTQARIPKTGSARWDGKWRIIMFDFPQKENLKRDMVRRLLKKNGYVSLQASVYINPHSLNREALEYLEESGLKKYIRMLKVEQIEEDADLRKRFGLPAYG